MLELEDKDIKKVFITLFHMFKKLSRNVEVFSLMTQIKLLEMKSTLERINSWLDIEKKVSLNLKT